MQTPPLDVGAPRGNIEKQGAHAVLRTAECPLLASQHHMPVPASYGLGSRRDVVEETTAR